LAPGEGITSAAPGDSSPAFPRCSRPPPVRRTSRATSTRANVDGGRARLRAVAAFLYARTEYIGLPHLVKQLFVSTATDLGCHEFFQGAGLVDLMRAMSTA
jgi:hypothetical protein